MKMSTTDNVAMLLVLAGGLNLGLIGFFEYNAVFELFGSDASRWVYGLVGIAAAYLTISWVMKATTKK